MRVDVERAGRMKIWGFISDRPIGFFHLSHGRRRRAHLVENSVKVKPDGSTGGHEPQTKSFSVDPRNQNQCYHVSCGGFFSAYDGIGVRLLVSLDRENYELRGRLKRSVIRYRIEMLFWLRPSVREPPPPRKFHEKERVRERERETSQSKNEK